MRAKKYFWNRKHHRELDRKMGLLRRFAEPFASLCEACGIDADIEGTTGMKFIEVTALLNYFDKVMPEKMKPLIIYDYLSNGIAHRFHRCHFGKN